MESNPELHGCLAFCIHCGIRFLTHPRNAGRLDLRCPFGCRQHHRKERSSQRSAAYYRTASGKWKKKRLNAKRCRDSISPECEQREALLHQTNSPDGQLPDELSVKVELQLDGVVLDDSSLVNSRILPYVRMVTSLIEGIYIDLNEILAALQQAMRQHSIATRSRTDYALCFLHQHPP